MEASERKGRELQKQVAEYENLEWQEKDTTNYECSFCVGAAISAVMPDSRTA